MKDQNLYLINIIECIERIESYTKDGRKAFMQNTMAQDAVVRNFEIIGEASKQISEHIKKKHPEVPWKHITGFRNILIHEYLKVDLNEVWSNVEKEMPVLKQQIEIILSNRKGK